MFFQPKAPTPDDFYRRDLVAYVKEKYDLVIEYDVLRRHLDELKQKLKVSELTIVSPAFVSLCENLAQYSYQSVDGVLVAI
jgi:uncharacterized protein Usg